MRDGVDECAERIEVPTWFPFARANLFDEPRHDAVGLDQVLDGLLGHAGSLIRFGTDCKFSPPHPALSPSGREGIRHWLLERFRIDQRRALTVWTRVMSQSPSIFLKLNFNSWTTSSRSPSIFAFNVRSTSAVSAP